MALNTHSWLWVFPRVGFHHVLMMLVSVSIIMCSVLLAGCTSNGMSNVYLMSLQYKAPSTSIPTLPGEVDPAIAHAVHNISRAANETTLQVRVGYMGICVGQDEFSFICSNHADALARLTRAGKKTITLANTSTEVTPDPLNLIMIAEEFRQKIVFDGLLYVTIVISFVGFSLLASFPGWHEERNDDDSEVEVKPFPSRPVSHMASFSLSVAFMFGFVSVLWQHINSSATASMTETLTYGAVSGHVGPAAMALGWISVGLVGVAALGLLLMIMSISLLRQLVDDE